MAARLYKHLRVHQIFGANTNVGKTILTTALCRSSVARNKRVFYLKPVSTGPPAEADDLHLVRFSDGQIKLSTDCLFRYNEPVSPHLAVVRDNRVSAVPRREDDLALYNRGLFEVHLEIISDEQLVKAVGNHIATCAAETTDPAVMYVETAGGVNSPVMSGSTQVNAYRSLFLPIILVGDANLGGISTTISAYESLLLRGYQVDLVTMFVDHYHQNFSYIQQYFAEQNIPFYGIDPPPPRQEDPGSDQLLTEEYYSSIISRKNGSSPMVYEMEEALDKSHIARLTNLESMPRRTLDSIWWPFEQHQSIKQSDVAVIDSAHGDFLNVFRTQDSKPEGNVLSPKLDGSASWWTQVLGHAHPSLTLAAAKAAGRYGHVIFPQATHLPALKLAETLIHKGPGSGWASRAFFTDDGSTGMEVALKMALRATAKREGWEKHANTELGILGLKGSYHGDTIGAMDACEEGIFTCEWHNSKGYWLDPPVVGIAEDGVRVTLPQSWREFKDKIYVFDSVTAVYDVEKRLLSPLAKHYRQFINEALSQVEKSGKLKLAALVIEPLLMGAGGMIFVDPLFQRILVDFVRGVIPDSSHFRKEGLPVIFDEVFVGLYRLGVRSCSSILGVYPDIGVYAKILTGGLVPMAVTLASSSIFEAFLGDTKAEALLHGHSYTAHPVGCEVANETLTRLEDLASSSSTWEVAKKNWSSLEDTPAERKIWSFWENGFIYKLAAHPNVEEVMTLGTVLAFKIRDGNKGYVSASAQSSLSFLRNKEINDNVNSPFGVHYRTLGNVAYFICNLNTRPETLRAFESALLSGL